MIKPLTEDNRRRLEAMRDSTWVPGIKAYMEPPNSMGFGARSLALMEHRVEETKYLMKTIRNLAAEILAAHEPPAADAPFEELVKRAGAARNNAGGEIAKIANTRLRQLAAWFRQSFPKRRLKIVFGNGGELVMVDDLWLSINAGEPSTIGALGKASSVGIHTDHTRKQWPHRSRDKVACLQPISDAIIDIYWITNWYRHGCPDDVIIEPTE